MFWGFARKHVLAHFDLWISMSRRNCVDVFPRSSREIVEVVEVGCVGMILWNGRGGSVSGVAMPWVWSAVLEILG